jgi:hypothetical protein
VIPTAAKTRPRLSVVGGVPTAAKTAKVGRLGGEKMICLLHLINLYYLLALFGVET